MQKNLVTSEKGNLIAFLKRMIQTHERVVIVCDETIKPLHLDNLLEELPVSLPLFCNKAGESGKTRQSKAAIEDFLFSHHVGRNDLMIAIGGGALLDCAGFAASSYLRGLNYVSLPTTLLAMCDAAIGGKTGINTPYGKNTLGAFHPPKVVVSYLPFLQTLSAQKMLDGAAEVLKYSLISAPQLTNLMDKVWFDKEYERLFVLEKLITLCQKIKQDVVRNDPFDKAERKLLNFGHTVGHSLEVLSNFSISHGQAVAIGMATEAFIAQEMGLADPQLADSIIAYLEKLGFELTVLVPRDIESYIHLMRRDKKNQEGAIHMVLLKKWGWCHIEEGKFTHGVDEVLIRKALTWMQARFCQTPMTQEA